ncbi:MAG: class II fructose-bisphosphate aldolase [Rhodocyclaceae bacterium]|nr:class II fructose-bisphosphate aldolase [Rhodocyclaceae bacterium]
MPLIRVDDLLRHARTEGYAVGAYDAVDSNFVSAIIAGAEAARAPVIVSFAELHFGHYDFPVLMAAAKMAARRARVPVALFFDHGTGLETAIDAIRHGANGVMADVSDLPFQDNVAVTRAIVDMAHAVGVTVEGEVGYVPGVAGKDAILHPGEIQLTSTIDAVRYVAETGVDALAVSIGTVHGRIRDEVKLDLDRLAAIARAVAVPLVIHGGTGLADEQFRAIIERGVSKVNYYTALSDLASAAAAAALDPIDAGYTAGLDAVRNVVAAEVARTCEIFGAAGRSDAAQAVCRLWQEDGNQPQIN